MKSQTPALPLVIVDDVEEDSMLMEGVLRQCKILNPVRVLRTGDECLGLFESRAGEAPAPCILFLDLIMAPVSGLEVLRGIHRNPWPSARSS